MIGRGKYFRIERAVITGDDADLRAAMNDKEILASRRATRNLISNIASVDSQESCEFLAGIVRSGMDSTTRALATAALGRRTSLTAEKTLIEASNSEDRRVRNEALRALADFDSAEAVEALGSALLREDKEAADFAIVALCKIGLPNARSKLLGALESPRPSIRRRAIRVLAENGDRLTIEMLKNREQVETWLNRITIRQAIEAAEIRLAANSPEDGR